MNLKDPNIPEEMYKFTLLLISSFKGIDKNRDNGSVLIFLPGIFEIGRLRSHLAEHRDAWVFPYYFNYAQQICSIFYFNL